MLSTQYKLIRFIKKAGAVHDKKYNYEKVSYVDAKTKVIIICPIHGEFEQTPDGHVQGRGCKTCGIEKRADSKRLGQEEFIKRASAIHEGKYDYSSVVYVRNNKKVIIINLQLYILSYELDVTVRVLFALHQFKMKQGQIY